MPTHDPLVEALIRSDEQRRPERVARIRWVDEHNIGGAILGPVEGMNLFREARECFVEGHYIAALMLATALIEHLVAEALLARGLAKHGVSFESAIKLAQANSVFPLGLLLEADRLRRLRNPFAHLKPEDHKYSLGNRYTAEGRHPMVIAEEDAKASLVAMYGHFRHVLAGI